MSPSRIIQSGPISAGELAPQPLYAVGAVLLASFLANFDSRLFAADLDDPKLIGRRAGERTVKRA